MARLLVLAAAALALVSGCVPSLRLKKVDAAQEKPANVYVLFGASHGPEPVAGLGPEAFHVTEDGFPVAEGTDRVLVNPDLRGQIATVLLLDLGGRPSEADLQLFSEVAGAFVDRVGAGRRLAVYVLDGSAEPLAVVPFGTPAEVAHAATDRLAKFRPRDPSTDLHGSYLSVWRALDRRLDGAEARLGAVVLVARGPDRTARVSIDAVRQELRKAQGDVARYAVGYGPEALKAPLREMADDTPAFPATPDALRASVGQLLDTLEQRARSFYLLSYCSSARAGSHRVRIEATRRRVNPKGGEELDRGDLTYPFVADGFGGGCVPRVPRGWK